ncbi:MAG: class I SAM-dependent methyltransferase [Rhodospirillales bacterium]|jgi:ubiquinone/menaquinone biosynthesis C-methylase UbiE|nr:class I SAM-dependent methyltransferase [Rhodospirillales bacterium]
MPVLLVHDALGPYLRRMGIYHDRLLPWLIDKTMRSGMLAPYRLGVVGTTHGRILEIGIGSGHNLAFYGSAATEVVGLDMSAALLAKAAEEAVKRRLPVRLVRADGASLPFTDAAFDAAVLTWTLCSIADPAAALTEIRRVLKPGGTLHYVEHGRAPEPEVRRLQDLLTPAWRRLSGGCHLNREMDALIEAAGFRLAEGNAGYAAGPRFVAYFYSGRAIADGPDRPALRPR